MNTIDIAEAILSRATQRVEVSAQNLANLTTPAYKAHRFFAAALDQGAHQAGPPVDFTVGKLQQTGNPLDLAIAGSGFFAVRSGDTVYYTRNGQFGVDDSGRLVTSGGLVVQSSQGDVVTGGGAPTIAPDGTVHNDGAFVARLRLVDFADLSVLKPMGGGLFAAPAGAGFDAASPTVRQGMLEASNVSPATEMLSMMSALRSAQTGQRVVQIYDDLMGRALTAFGQM